MAGSATLRISGTALSPEFVYALGPGALMPDERRFGILYMPERVLAAAYDLEGAFNAVSLKLVRGSNPDNVIAALDRLLDRYGGLGGYTRKDQLSHAFLDAELQQLRAMSRILPPIFLLVSAFLVNMTLSRLIALEREQIGLLKAMGYSSLAVVRHYAGFVTLIALAGIAIGVVAGTWLGTGMTKLYAQFFSFPFLVFSRNPAVYGIAVGATYAAALLGAVKAVREVAWLSPAVAMSPPAPQRYRKVLGGIVDMSRFVQAVERHRHAPPDALAAAHAERHSGHGAGGGDPGGLALGLRLDQPHDRRDLPHERPAGCLDHLHLGAADERAVRGAAASRRHGGGAIPRAAGEASPWASGAARVARGQGGGRLPLTRARWRSEARGAAGRRAGDLGCAGEAPQDRDRRRGRGRDSRRAAADGAAAGLRHHHGLHRPHRLHEPRCDEPHAEGRRRDLRRLSGRSTWSRARSCSRC